MKYNNCEKKSTDYSSQQCCCQPIMNSCNYPSMDYKDSVLSCNSSLTPSVSIPANVTSGTSFNLGSINVNSSCVKCPSTLLSYMGYLTLVSDGSDITIPAGTTLTLTITKQCGYNTTAIPVAQVITTLPTLTAAPTTGPIIIPLSFQRCDSQIYNCCNSCCNSCYNNVCQYTLTATINYSGTLTIIDGNTINSSSLTAITSSSSCCCC